jgi:hypothetical protein
MLGVSADGKLCKELLRFLHSIDESGTSLRQAISEMDNPSDLDESRAKVEPASNFDHTTTTTTAPSTRVLALSNDFTPSNPIGPAPRESPRRSHQSHFRHPSAPSPSTSTTTSPATNKVSSPSMNQDRITSPFQLTSPRQAIYMTPPSPMTVYPNQGLGEGQMPMALGDFIEEEEVDDTA